MSGTAPTRAPTPVHSSRGRPLSDSVLEHIWCHKRMSRAEIARAVGLARSTVSEIVSRFVATSLVSEIGAGPSSGGRRPVVLEFQDDAHVILGIDMGASHVTVVLTDLRGRTLAAHDREHAVRDDPDGTTALILELADACLSDVDGARERLLGIGIAVPSPVDPGDPNRLSDIVLPAWRGHGGLNGLRDRYGVPVLIDNDANLGALAEYWWGAGVGVHDFAFIKLATGIGSGHIIGGHVYRGSSGVAGEIGHISIDPNGLPCVCGNRGCLATLAGTQALVERARALLAEYPDSALAQGTPTIEDIEDAAMSGDALANRLVQDAAENLGIAIAGLLNLMNPGAVILGGSLSRLGDRLIIPLREAVFTRTLVSSVAASRIRASELGDRGIALGAATHVLHEALSDPTLFPELSPT